MVQIEHIKTEFYKSKFFLLYIPFSRITNTEKNVEFYIT